MAQSHYYTKTLIGWSKTKEAEAAKCAESLQWSVWFFLTFN